MKKFERFCVYFIMSIMCMIFTYLTYTSFVRTAYMYDWEDTLFINDNILLNIAAVVVILCIGVLLVKKNVKIGDKFLKTYIIVINAIMVWFIMSTQFVSVDDQGQVLSAASAFLNGNYEPWNVGGYCFRWGHQNGIVLIYAFLSWIFGQGNVTVFQLLNLLFIGITFLYIYRSYRLLGVSENVSRLIYMALYMFMPYMMYVTYIYGTVIGLMFATVGFYYTLKYIKEQSVKSAIVTVLCLSMATVCKSNYFIFIIAFCIVVAVDILCSDRSELKSRTLKKAGLIATVIVMCVIMRLCTTFIVESRIGKKAPEGTPAILFVVMGIQEGWRAPGWSNSFDDIMYSQCNYDRLMTNEVGFAWFKNEAAKFLYNPDYLVRFFNRKTASIWANPTWECFEILKSRTSNTGVPDIIMSFMDVGSGLNLFVTEFLDVLQSILYFGALMYCLLGIKKARIKDMLLPLNFVGAFMFFMVWEARCHYTVPIAVYLIPISVLGYSMLCGKISGFWESVKTDGFKNVLCGINYKAYVNKTNIWLTFLTVAWILAAYFMVDYAIWQEDGAYADFLNNYTYETRIEDGSYKLHVYADDSLVVGTEVIDDGTRLTLVEESDSKSQYFTINHHFYENGLNHYFIWNDEQDKVLYLRDESLMYAGSVYLHNYDLNVKNLWCINNAGEGAFYIRNKYGMALSYNVEINQVVLMPFTGEDSQKWYVR